MVRYSDLEMSIMKEEAYYTWVVPLEQESQQPHKGTAQAGVKMGREAEGAREVMGRRLIVVSLEGNSKAR